MRNRAAMMMTMCMCMMSMRTGLRASFSGRLSAVAA